MNERKYGIWAPKPTPYNNEWRQLLRLDGYPLAFNSERRAKQYARCVPYLREYSVGRIH